MNENDGSGERKATADYVDFADEMRMGDGLLCSCSLFNLRHLRNLRFSSFALRVPEGYGNTRTVNREGILAERYTRCVALRKSDSLAE